LRAKLRPAVTKNQTIHAKCVRFFPILDHINLILDHINLILKTKNMKSDRIHDLCEIKKLNTSTPQMAAEGLNRLEKRLFSSSETKKIRSETIFSVPFRINGLADHIKTGHSCSSVPGNDRDLLPARERPLIYVPAQ
jgi:hypothetical protein